jgi:hypothetical protein
MMETLSVLRKMKLRLNAVDLESGTLVETAVQVSQQQQQHSLSLFLMFKLFTERCGTLHILENDDMIRMQNIEGGNATLKCHWGYLLSTGVKTQHLFCSNGEWTWPDKCYSKSIMLSLGFGVNLIPGTSCTTLPLSAHMKIDTEVTLSGTVVTATCDEGYLFANHSPVVKSFASKTHVGTIL